MPQLTFDLDLTALVYGGEALGRLPDGRAVFVPFALPGERVRVRLVEEKRGFARAELLEVLVPSPQRIQPRCAHFTDCGGCHYQMLDYPAQLAAKTNILRDQLIRIAGIPEPPVKEMVPSPNPWNYRNTLQFHLTREGRLGFQAAGGGRVVAIRECHLPEEALNQLWPRLELEPVPGLERVALRLSTDGEMLLVLEGSQPKAPELSVEELPVSAVYRGPSGVQVLAGDEAVVMEVLGRAFRVSAGSFFQVNTPMAEALLRHLLEELPLSTDGIALDVYCGVGLFSAFLASRVARVIAIEAAPSACADFIENLDEFENVALYEGVAEDVLPGLDVRPTLAIVDPPRAGLERTVLDALLRMHPDVLAYVSCDPATLARDTKRLLAGGYRLAQVTPFDLFPQTYHVESVSVFRAEVDSTQLTVDS
jgi:23S rRNA (uracil1939-C5)-methyltransferase